MSLVISWVDEKCEKSYAVLVTRQIHWEAKRIISNYCERFSIEVFYKDAKQQLGFSDYQCRREETIGKHWYMVFCAYSLLRLDMLKTPAYQKWQRKRANHQCCSKTSNAMGNRGVDFDLA